MIVCASVCVEKSFLKGEQKTQAVARIGHPCGQDRGRLTTAQQGLVHEPDVGQTLLTRLWDVHLVAGEHVSIVFLDLGWEKRCEGWAEGLPISSPCCLNSSSFPWLQDAGLGLHRMYGCMRTRTHTHTHAHTCAHAQLLTARSCFRFFFWALLC